MVQRIKKLRKLVPGYTMLPKGEYYKVQKVGMDAARVKTDPAYDAARQKWGPFRNVVRFQVLLRKALSSVGQAGYSAHGLQRCLLKVLNADAGGPDQETNFLKADLSPLLGFDLYAHRKWQEIVKVPLGCYWYEDIPGWVVHMPRFSPLDSIAPPEPMDYVRLHFIHVWLDFEQDQCGAQRKSTGILPVKEVKVRASNLRFEKDVTGKKLHLLLAAVTGYRKFPGDNALFKMEDSGPLVILNVAIPRSGNVS